MFRNLAQWSQLLSSKSFLFSPFSLTSSDHSLLCVSQHPGLHPIRTSHFHQQWECTVHLPQSRPSVGMEGEMDGTDGVRGARMLKTHWEETLRKACVAPWAVDGQWGADRVLEKDKWSLRRK